MSNQKTPRVLDRDGNELKVGSRVERAYADGARGGMGGVVERVDEQGAVCVAFTRVPTDFPSRRRFTPWTSYRCPDLLLIDPPSTEPTHIGENDG